ncbi:MAG: hypothetical protein RL748_3543, partial [Pseudomonadota bacterium]
MKQWNKMALTLATGLVGSLMAQSALADPYLVGRGMSDVTGEAAEVGMMG